MTAWRLDIMINHALKAVPCAGQVANAGQRNAKKAVTSESQRIIILVPREFHELTRRCQSCAILAHNEFHRPLRKQHPQLRVGIADLDGKASRRSDDVPRALRWAMRECEGQSKCHQESAFEPLGQSQIAAKHPKGLFRPPATFTEQGQMNPYWSKCRHERNANRGVTLGRK